MTSTSLILLQIAAVLLVCRLLSVALRRLHQPVVVSQMLAGVLIGPSLLGLWPAWRHLLFPPGSASLIAALSQLGLVLFMFCAGSELDLGLIRRRAGSTIGISIASVVVPLAAGILVATLLVHDQRLFPRSASAPLEVGFLGVAVAITAFPVMARIIAESGLLRTVAGSTSLAAGSFTDVVAWCLLAVLLAGLSGTAPRAAIALGAGLALAALTLLARLAPPAALVTRGLFEWVAEPWLPPLILIVLLVVGWASDAVGLHPAFGAFMVGLAMPRTELLTAVRRRIEPLATNVLLPLYFVSTGLSTSIGSVASPGLLLIGLLLLVTAVASKGISCWLVARFTGQSWRDAAVIGALMNTRGLVELVVLGIGLQHGVITPALFSIMVAIAILTTMMAGPVIAAIRPDAAREEDDDEAIVLLDSREYSVN
jgi:Kef-type K+ transport system membrane component KefB